MREIVLASLVAFYSVSLKFNTIFFHYAISKNNLAFLLFLPSLLLNFHLYFQFRNPDPIQRHLGRYYKLKLYSLIIWLIEWGGVIFLNWLLSKDLSTLIIESVFTMIGAGLEVYFIYTLKNIYKLAVAGEPMQPAQPGVEMKIENSINIEPVLHETIIQATEVNEVKSLPTKRFLSQQKLPPNDKVDVVDFTRAKTQTKFTVEVVEMNE
jgi:hypothetical protein